MKLAHDRGLRGRDLLRAFRRGEGRRDAAAAGHRARLRLAVLRDGRRRAPARRICRRHSGQDVRVVRAPCMGACDHAPVCAVGHVQVMQGEPTTSVKNIAHADHACACAASPAPTSSTTWPPAAIAARRDASPASARATNLIKIVSDAGLARPRRRRLSHRPQMVAGARRAGPAPVGGQRRRGRARHLQGPPLSRARSAPLPRRHADRRLGGRGAPRSTSTSATNIPSFA